MKKKQKILIIIITIIVIIAAIITIVIKNINEENNKLNTIMKEITITYNLLENNINTYNNNRTNLSNLLDTYYTDNLSNDYNQYISILSEQEDTINAIYTNVEDLSKNCKDRLFSKKEINNICTSYEEYYETVVNIYLNDQLQINEMIKIYNASSTSPLEEYHSTTLTDYIDYNHDGNYIERED
ncbi:MAG: hypothetical protein IJ509_00810 [Bacilli bacterium]|nr:hypothetical protein [Bacilli bacterium]